VTPARVVSQVLPYAAPPLLSPFDRIALGALALTAAVAAVAHGTVAESGIVSPGAVVIVFTFLVGFLHNAVGYVFLFRAPAVRTQRHARPLAFAGKLLAALALSAPFYVDSRILPMASTLFFLHAGENVAYQVQRLAPPSDRPPDGALFPLAFVLSCASVGPLYVAEWYEPNRQLQLAMLVAGLLVLRWLLPPPRWSDGWALLRRTPLTAALLASAALLAGTGGEIFYLFVLWHYLTWIIYTWIRQPGARSELVRWNALFALLYVPVIALAVGRTGLVPPALTFLVISPLAFLAQSTTHIMVTGAFRTYAR
jgi:hypothetical protein